MAVKAPGFNDNPGSRNRRVNRFAVAGGTRADRRHKLTQGTGIDFNTTPKPDEIGDTGNDLGKFEVDENFNVAGSTSNDGDYTAQTVAAGTIGVDQALPLTEVAGDDVKITSLNNRIGGRFD